MGRGGEGTGPRLMTGQLGIFYAKLLKEVAVKSWFR